MSNSHSDAPPAARQERPEAADAAPTIGRGQKTLTGLGREQIAAALRAEQQRGWEEGRPPRLEDYRELLDQSGAIEDDWIDLICNEVYLRERHGEKPGGDEYVQRFPWLAERIKHQFSLLGVPANGRRSAPPTAIDPAQTSSSVALFEPPPIEGALAAIPVNRAAPTDRIDTPPRLPKVVPPPVSPGVEIPGYEILGELGRGGMGIVYKARQKVLNRLVALKMILAHKRQCEDLHARFMREAESVARLKHPNIVQVYEIGEHEGKPFLSLEFVDGGTLDEFIDGRPQSPEFAAQIAEQIARAVQHAHEHDVIHRDLKPANILLAKNRESAEEGREKPVATSPHPSASGLPPLPGPLTLLPKLTDFGLAKQLDNHDALTATHAVAGTPAYMAPEQVYAGKKHEVGPRSDVWAIGVILYEMLTGRAPFMADTPLEVMRLVAHGEPVPPSRLQPRTPRDLETICLRCLQKDPTKRYTTARELADDLRSFREEKPILARPVGALEQAWGWCKRNPVVASLLTAVAVTLVLGTGFATYFAISAADQARRAEKKSDEATRSAQEATRARDEEARLNKEALRREERRGHQLYAANMSLARRDWEAGRVARTRQILASYGSGRQGGSDLRGFEWFFLDRLCRLESIRLDAPAGTPLAVSPDGKHLVWADGDAAEVWSVETRKKVWSLRGHAGPVRCVAFDPTGAHLASAATDGAVRLWDARTGSFLRSLEGPSQPATGLCFAPDGRRLARVGSAENGSGELHVWDVKAGTLSASPTRPLPGLRGLVYASRWLASVGKDGAVHVWDPAGEALTTLTPRGEAPVSLATPPRGGLLACGTASGGVVIWDAESWRVDARLHGHRGPVEALAFTPDGLTLASAGEDAVVRLWDVTRGKAFREFPGHVRGIEALAYARTGSLLFSASRDGTVKGWDTAREPEYSSLTQPGPAVGLHAVTGGRFAAVNAAGECLLADGGRRIASFPLVIDGSRATIRDTALTADGSAVVVCRGDDRLFRCGVSDRRPVQLNLSGLRPGVRRVVCAPDGERLATIHADGVVQLHRFDDALKPTVVRLGGATVTAAAFHPKALTHIALGTADGVVALWDLTAGKPLFTARNHKGAVRSVAFAPDGKLFASASDDATAKLWDGTGNETANPERHTLEGHAAGVWQVSFDPAGGRVVTGGEDRTVKIWDVESGQETLTLPAHLRGVVAAGFSRDGRTLFTRSEDGEVRSWESGAP